jgi:hypothetical protein
VRPGKVLVVFEDEASTTSRWVKTEDLPKLRVVEKVEKEDDKDERDADSEINLMKIGVEAPKVVDYLGLREQVMAFTEVVAGDIVTVFVNGRQRRGRVVQVRDSDRGAKATVKYKSRYFGTSKVEVDVASNKLSVDYGCYSVDDSKARKSDGLAYRLSTNLSDKTVRIARWGSTVIGVDQGDGWVRAVEGGYLPEKIGNERVLFALQEKCHCETNHVRKIGDAFVAKVDMRVDGELVLKGDLSVLKEVLENGDAWMFFEKLGAVKHVEKKDLAKFEISVDWPGEQCSRRKKEKSKKWLPKVKQVTGSGVTYSTVEVPKEELSEEMRAPVRAFEEEQKRRTEEEERRRREAEEKRQMEKEKEEKRQREEEEKRRREAEPDRREVKREMERDDIIWMEEETE